MGGESHPTGKSSKKAAFATLIRREKKEKGKKTKLIL